jgi:hypothetical protein
VVGQEQRVAPPAGQPLQWGVPVLLGWGFQRQPAPTLAAAGLAATPMPQPVPLLVLLAVLVEVVLGVQ